MKLLAILGQLIRSDDFEPTIYADDSTPMFARKVSNRKFKRAIRRTRRALKEFRAAE